MAALVWPSSKIAWLAHAGGAVGAPPPRVVTTPGAGAANTGLPAAPGRLGLRVKHRRGWGYPPGSKVAMGAHRKGVVMVRR
jgi:hypothetical protein